MPKQFFTYEQQLNKLKNEKQLTIPNSAYAKEVLEKLGLARIASLYFFIPSTIISLQAR